jgi:hypothetical protein
MFSVLLETLKQYNIEYNIIRYLFFIIPYITYTNFCLVLQEIMLVLTIPY